MSDAREPQESSVATDSRFLKWEGEAPAEPFVAQGAARQEPRPPEKPPSGIDSETIDHLGPPAQRTEPREEHSAGPASPTDPDTTDGVTTDPDAPADPAHGLEKTPVAGIGTS